MGWGGVGGEEENGVEMEWWEMGEMDGGGGKEEVSSSWTGGECRSYVVRGMYNIGMRPSGFYCTTRHLSNIRHRSGLAGLFASRLMPLCVDGLGR